MACHLGIMTKIDFISIFSLAAGAQEADEGNEVSLTVFEDPSCRRSQVTALDTSGQDQATNFLHVRTCAFSCLRFIFMNTKKKV